VTTTDTPKQGPTLEEIEEILDDVPATETKKTPLTELYSDYDEIKIKTEALKLRLLNEQQQQIISLRRSWSILFGFVLLAILIFEISLTVFVGLGKLDFKEYQWLVNIVITGGIAQIIAMPLIVAKFLFSEQSLRSA